MPLSLGIRHEDCCGDRTNPSSTLLPVPASSLRSPRHGSAELPGGDEVSGVPLGHRFYLETLSVCVGVAHLAARSPASYGRSLPAMERSWSEFPSAVWAGEPFTVGLPPRRRCQPLRGACRGSGRRDLALLALRESVE